jgi:hypothetical protein
LIEIRWKNNAGKNTPEKTNNQVGALITYNSTKGIGILAQININRRSFTPQHAVKNAEEHWNIRKRGVSQTRKRKADDESIARR